MSTRANMFRGYDDWKSSDPRDAEPDAEPFQVRREERREKIRAILRKTLIGPTQLARFTVWEPIISGDDWDATWTPEEFNELVRALTEALMREVF